MTAGRTAGCGAVFCVLLAWAGGWLPRAVAQWGGSLGWLCPLVVLAAAPVLFAVADRAEELAPGDKGAFALFPALLGRRWGAVGAGVTLAGLIAVLGLAGALCAQRLHRAGFRTLPQVVLLLVLLGLSCAGGRGSAGALERAGVLCAKVVASAVAVIGLFALPGGGDVALLAPEVGGAAALPAGALPVLGVLGYAVLAVTGPVPEGERKREMRRMRRSWTIGMAAALTAVQVALQSRFGAEETARLEGPLLRLVAGIGVAGAFQRLEAAVAALWVLPELVLLALLARACLTLREEGMGLPAARYAPVQVGAAAFLLGAPRLAGYGGGMAHAALWVGIAGGLLGFFLVPGLVVLAKMQKKGNPPPKSSV